jgi:hypothetical protein
MPPPAGASRALYDELSEHMASGVVMYVATRDAGLMPESMVAMGAKAECERGVVTVYLPKALAEPTRKNLEDNGEVALTMTRPRDHKSIQVKGKAREVREAVEAKRELQAVHRAALVECFAGVGIPREITRRVVWWPSLAVEIDVREVYSQTPGPRAGERMPGL